MELSGLASSMTILYCPETMSELSDQEKLALAQAYRAKWREIGAGPSQYPTLKDDLFEGWTNIKGGVYANFGVAGEYLELGDINNLSEEDRELLEQLEQDLGIEGDYPGVCKKSESDFYFQNCPDPRPLL